MRFIIKPALRNAVKQAIPVVLQTLIKALQHHRSIGYLALALGLATAFGCAFSCFCSWQL